MTTPLSPKGLEALARIRKRDPKSFATAAEHDRNRPEDRAISTGLASVDRLIGSYGGIPRGRWTQVYGESQAGKSTLVAHVVAQAQRDGLRCAWIDMEATWESEYAAAIGVDVDALDLSQPLTAEEAVETMQDLAFAGDWGLIVLDSVGAMNPSKIYEREVGQPLPAIRARMVAEMFQRVNAPIARNNVAVVLVNHLTSTMEQVNGRPVMVPAGGQKMKYYPTLNVSLFRRSRPLDDQGKPVEGDREAAGSSVIVKIEKNKVGRAFRQAELVHQFMRGFDALTDLVRTAVDLGVVSRSGSWYTFGEGEEQVKKQGEPGFIEAIRANFDVAPRLYRATLDAIRAETEHERRAALEAGEATRGLLEAADD